MDEQTRKALELARSLLWSAASNTYADRVQGIKAIDEALAPATAAPVEHADLVEAVDRVLAEAPCECGERLRFDRGEHLSGCYLFDLNEARNRASASAAPVAQPVGRMSRATMVLGSGAGYKEVAFRFADLEDAEQVRLWAETCGAKLDTATAAPVARRVSEPSDEDIMRVARAHGTGGWQTLHDMMHFARAVLALRPAAPRAPLTDEQASALWQKHLRVSGLDGGSIHGGVELIRATERAHGIGQGDA